MKLRSNGPIVVSSALLFASIINPLAGRANQSTRLDSSRVQPARASHSTSYRHDAKTSYRSAGKTIEFDAPGAATAVSAACSDACGTFALGNNGAGTITGYYTDGYVVPHGFIRERTGRFLSFDAPGAGLGHGRNEGTVPYAINAAGAIVGQYEDANTIYHGFVRERNGSFETFSVPGAGTKPGGTQGTLAWDLNGHGDTAGVYIDGKGVEHGFVRSWDHRITTFDPPGSVLTYVCVETCLSDVGVVGRYYDKHSIAHGFLRAPNGKITTFDAPGAGRAAGQGTGFQSVNAQGTIAGAIRDSHSVYHAFVRYRNGSYRIGELPGAGHGPTQGTGTNSINALDAVAGTVIEADDTVHAFEYFRSGVLLRFDAPDAVAVTQPSTNNVRGEIAGWYSDKNGLNHGFLWLP